MVGLLVLVDSGVRVEHCLLRAEMGLMVVIASLGDLDLCNSVHDPNLRV